MKKLLPIPGSDIIRTHRAVLCEKLGLNNDTTMRELTSALRRYRKEALENFEDNYLSDFATIVDYLMS